MKCREQDTASGPWNGGERVQPVAVGSLDPVDHLSEVWGVGMYLGCCEFQGWARPAGGRGRAWGPAASRGAVHMEVVAAALPWLCPGPPESPVFVHLSLLLPGPHLRAQEELGEVTLPVTVGAPVRHCSGCVPTSVGQRP